MRQYFSSRSMHRLTLGPRKISERADALESYMLSSTSFSTSSLLLSFHHIDCFIVILLAEAQPRPNVSESTDLLFHHVLA
jgi:hypothetical protein